MAEEGGNDSKTMLNGMGLEKDMKLLTLVREEPHYHHHHSFVSWALKGVETTGMPIVPMLLDLERDRKLVEFMRA